MVGIIIASHGSLAEGILQAGEMIFGKQDNVAACTLLPSEGPEDIKRKIKKAISSFDSQDEILILADLWGGTPFNQASQVIASHEDKWAIIAGVNLPMAIAAFGERFGEESAQAIAKNILGEGKNNIKIYPESLSPKVDTKAEDAKVVKGSIPEGTVIGDGKFNYVLARIDTRLLHGQVATSWTKTTKPDRIIVVSDNVAQDDLRKNMIMQATPPGVTAHVVPIWKMIEVSKDPRFGGTRAMLLFETPQDVLKTIEGGVDLKEINLGSIAHSLGKAVITTSVAMGKEDYETLDKLRNMGIKFDVRKVPTDKGENFDNMMKKAKEQLY